MKRHEPAGCTFVSFLNLFAAVLFCRLFEAGNYELCRFEHCLSDTAGLFGIAAAVQFHFG
jgi:hypothetical protein